MIMYQHSGRSGDLLYSLPACIERAGNEQFDFHLHTNRLDPFDPSDRGVMQTHAEAEFTASILRVQPYIRNITISDDDCVPLKDTTRVINLDRFRDVPEPYSLTECRYWYTRILPVKLNDIHKPWLTVPEATLPKLNKVCISFTERYQPNASPMALKPFADDLIFIGLPKEHKRFCSMYFDVPYHPVKDLVELLQFVKSTKGWCSNVSGVYAANEGAATPRVLCVPGGSYGDVRPYTPNGIAVVDDAKLVKCVEALFSR